MRSLFTNIHTHTQTWFTVELSLEKNYCRHKNFANIAIKFVQFFIYLWPIFGTFKVQQIIICDCAAQALVRFLCITIFESPYPYVCKHMYVWTHMFVRRPLCICIYLHPICLSVYLSVCMCVFVGVYIDAHMHMNSYICKYELHARTHARTHTRTHARTHVRTHACLFKYVGVYCVCM